MIKAWILFKWWIVKLLGGERTKYVQIPSYHPRKPMTLSDWEEIRAMKERVPAFFKWLHGHMEDIESQLLILNPEADRERLIISTRVADCLNFMNLPLLADSELKKAEFKTKNSRALNNLGIIEKGEK
jgi:hypothetical protein